MLEQNSDKSYKFSHLSFAFYLILLHAKARYSSQSETLCLKILCIVSVKKSTYFMSSKCTYMQIYEYYKIWKIKKKVAIAHAQLNS